MTDCIEPDGGFSFCGVDIADLGLTYVPENKDTYVYRPAKYTPHEETFEAHDGGYFFGTTVKPKEFTLRCFYEGHHLDSGLMPRIYDLFRRGRTGKLIFSRRPWMWYDATVMDVDDTQLASVMNGLIRITMKAYYPFGRSEMTYIPEGCNYTDDLIANTGMLRTTEWNLDTDLMTQIIDSTLPSPQPAVFYNPGTEYAHTAIIVKGTLGSGIRITNSDTNQECHIVGPMLTGDELIIDGLSGKVLKKNGSNVSYSFINHDNGFIDLAPGFPVIMRGVHVSGASGSSQLTMDGSAPYPITELDIGKYIAFPAGGSTSLLGLGMLGNMVLGSDEHASTFCSKIIGVNDNTITVENPLPDIVSVEASVLPRVNHLTISKLDSGDVSVDITKLEIKFYPTFS